MKDKEPFGRTRHAKLNDAKQERDDISYHAQIFKNELIATSQKVEKMEKDVREN